MSLDAFDFFTFLAGNGACATAIDPDPEIPESEDKNDELGSIYEFAAWLKLLAGAGDDKPMLELNLLGRCGEEKAGESKSDLDVS